MKREKIGYLELENMGASRTVMDFYRDFPDDCGSIDIVRHGDTYSLTCCDGYVSESPMTSGELLKLLEEMAAEYARGFTRENPDKWLEDHWINMRILPHEPITLEGARETIEAFIAAGWKLPLELTAAKYMAYINEQMSINGIS